MKYKHNTVNIIYYMLINSFLFMIHAVFMFQDNLLLIYCAQNPNSVSVYPLVISNPGGEFVYAKS